MLLIVGTTAATRLKREMCLHLYCIRASGCGALARSGAEGADSSFFKSLNKEEIAKIYLIWSHAPKFPLFSWVRCVDSDDFLKLGQLPAFNVNEGA